MPIGSRSFLKPFVLAMSLLPGLASADMPVTYMDGTRALFQINAPDFWTVRAGGPRDLTAPGDDTARGVVRVLGLQPSADPHVWMGFVAPEDVSNFEEARVYLREIGPHLVKDAQVDDISTRTVGGLPAETFSGTGRRNGRTVGFTAVTIDLPNGRMAIAVTVLEDGATPDIIEDVNRVFASFKAIR